MRYRLMTVIAGVAALTGCGPDLNGVLNKLREENISQGKQIADLKTDVALRDAKLKDLQAEAEAKTPPVQRLPEDRLKAMFTASKIEIRKQTDVWDFGSSTDDANAKPHLKGFRVFVRVTADDGTVIPATGEIVIEAFSLPKAPADPVRIGTWEFSADAMKKRWYDTLGLKQFAFDCPWEKKPASGPMSFRVTFTDALTGRTFTSELNKTITITD